MNSADLINLQLEFVECAVHQILHARAVYPEVIFGRCTKYGMSVWQCRHADVNTFIRRVLANTKPLVESNVLQKVSFVTLDTAPQPLGNNAATTLSTSYSSNSSSIPGAVKDEIAIEFRGGAWGAISATPTSNPSAPDEVQALVALEEDLRSSLLRLTMALDRMPRFDPEQATWTLQLSTRDDRSLAADRGAGAGMGTSVGAKQQRALEQALQSNEWLRSTPKEQQPHTPSPFHSDDSSKSSVSSSAMQHADGRSLVPISSHHNAFFDCISLYAIY